MPKVDEKETSNDTNEENNSSDNEKNDAYGSYDNPDGSSTDSHHFFDDTTASPSLSKHSRVKLFVQIRRTMSIMHGLLACLIYG